MPSEAHEKHLLIIEDDKGQEEYTLEQAIYSIGRDPRCDIRLVSQFVSRHHATLRRHFNEDGSYDYCIEDGNFEGQRSANGLIINGRSLQSHTLKHLDVIIFGPQVRATYYRLRRDPFSTTPPDEFDITLINPATAEKTAS
ncbi:MAG TPA: FHA domain-containing protein [Synechococcales cyanobacterium M55_K2018_004]|nr:FHA domain-containing protein [Synechococcales cyanobacterium M55_K2018_004]